jgi:hypothetical protein
VRVVAAQLIRDHHLVRETRTPPRAKNHMTEPDATSSDAAGDIATATAFLRHTLATLAYRVAKPLRDAPPDFGEFRVGPTSRTPAQIVAHIGDLMDWALTTAQNRTKWRDSPVQAWSADVERLFAGITVLDEYLAGGNVRDPEVLEQLFQGPVADALTHTGQLTMLRRLASAPIKGENYQRALIAAGQTGIEQPPPQREF